VYIYTYRTSIAEGTTESNKGAEDKNGSDGVLVAGCCVAGALISEK
jgi:hypothetical protein